MYNWWSFGDRLVATSACISRLVSMLFCTYVCFFSILFDLTLFHVFLLLYWSTANKVEYKFRVVVVVRTNDCVAVRTKQCCWGRCCCAWLRSRCARRKNRSRRRRRKSCHCVSINQSILLTKGQKTTDIVTKINTNGDTIKQIQY